MEFSGTNDGVIVNSIDQLQADARRYRWLKATNPALVAAIAYSVPLAWQYSINDVDRCVDAAMGTD